MKPRSILLASALLAAAPAHAATYIITYTGTVYNGNDYTGVFGGSGRSLDGLDYTAVYTLTMPLLGVILDGDGSTTSKIRGGSNYSTPSPLSATLKINGVTQTISGESSGRVEQYNEYGSRELDSLSYYAAENVPGLSIYYPNHVDNDIHSYINNIIDTFDYINNFTYNKKVEDISGGSFALYGYNNAGGYAYQKAYGDLRPASVTITVASGVPEPATWALMILGFGLVGGVMRQQRRKVRVGYG